VSRAVGSRQKAVGRSITRIRAALAGAHHHTHASWAGMRTRIRALTNQELLEALELEKLGKRRTEHLKLIDNEIRRRHGDAGPRQFRVETRF